MEVALCLHCGAVSLRPGGAVAEVRGFLAKCNSDEERFIADWSQIKSKIFQGRGEVWLYKGDKQSDASWKSAAFCHLFSCPANFLISPGLFVPCLLQSS